MPKRFFLYYEKKLVSIGVFEYGETKIWYLVFDRKIPSPYFMALQKNNLRSRRVESQMYSEITELANKAELGS